MNLIFTCGGTAGHINPAIAIANRMKERFPDCKILFIGATGHMEEKLVPQAGFALKCLPGSGLSRGKNWAALKKNAYAVKCVLTAVSACKKIYREFQPDAVIGTGGYASFPALYAAQTMGIPNCVHESNALPGLTTKMAANRASRVLVAFDESVSYYRHPERVEVVGMPLQKDFLYLSREEARQQLGLGEEHLVVSAFGSLGAKRMNELMAEVIPMEKAEGYPFRHIHATGSFGWEWMPDLLRQKGVDFEGEDRLDIREYIYNMPTVMAAADVVISRAGSSTCNEICACGTPCILIPSPNVTNNHQEKNARVLAQREGAVMILEKDCTAELLYDQIKALLADVDRRKKMICRLQEMVRMDSTERICDILEELVKT